MIETLDPQMIATYLQGAGYRFYRSAESDSFLVLFAPRDLGDVGTQVHIDCDEAVLSLRVVTDRLFAPEQKARLDALCNEWHQEYRWPMVYVRTRSNGLLGLVAEGHLNTTGAGIHQGLVDKFCSVIINCAHDFWDWILRQDLEGLPEDAADLDSDLGELLDASRAAEVAGTDTAGTDTAGTDTAGTGTSGTGTSDSDIALERTVAREPRDAIDPPVDPDATGA